MFLNTRARSLFILFGRIPSSTIAETAAPACQWRGVAELGGEVTGRSMKDFQNGLEVYIGTQIIRMMAVQYP